MLARVLGDETRDKLVVAVEVLVGADGAEDDATDVNDDDGNFCKGSEMANEETAKFLASEVCSTFEAACCRSSEDE